MCPTCAPSRSDGSRSAPATHLEARATRHRTIAYDGSCGTGSDFGRDRSQESTLLTAPPSRLTKGFYSPVPTHPDAPTDVPARVRLAPRATAGRAPAAPPAAFTVPSQAPDQGEYGVRNGPAKPSTAVRFRSPPPAFVHARLQVGGHFRGARACPSATAADRVLQVAVDKQKILTNPCDRVEPPQRASGVSCRFHDLRHSSVALAIAAGAHPKAIQARMGHSSINVTLDR